MAALYVIEQGATIHKESERLVVRKGNDTLQVVPIIKVNQVIVFGNVQLTTQAVKYLLQEGIDVIFLSQDGHYFGRLVGRESRFGELRQRQYHLARDEAFQLGLAQQFVVGKLLNLRTLLMRYHRDDPREALREAIDGLGECLEHAPRTVKVSSLLGVEGQGAALYFGAFKELLQQDLGFQRRRRHPAPDPVNALLGFGYTLLVHNIEAAVHVVGLDPYVGFLHALKYGRLCLALDLMEEFRPIIVDSIVLRAVNSGLLKREDFTFDEAADCPVLLSDDGKRRFIGLFEERVNTKIIYPPTGEQAAYRRVFELQVRRLAQCLESGKPSYQPFTVR